MDRKKFKKVELCNGYKPAVISVEVYENIGKAYAIEKGLKPSNPKYIYEAPNGDRISVRSASDKKKIERLVKSTKTKCDAEFEAFEELFIDTNTYKRFFAETFKEVRESNYSFYDLVAKYGAKTIAAEFIKWKIDNPMIYKEDR